MTQWLGKDRERLFELYRRHVDGLRRDVSGVNRSLGSPRPQDVKLGALTRAEFEALLADPLADPEAVQLWLRRIIRGHEDEFPSLQAAG